MKPLTGNTFPIKEAIRQAGGKWDPKQKVWMIPDEKYEQLSKLIPPETKIRVSGQLWESCDICGQEPIYMSHGVCEGCANKGYRR